MYSYWIINKKTAEKTVIFGHSRAQAFKKYSLNEAEWDIDFVDYED